METEIPACREPPLAKISGIQFGLLTSDDIYCLSVFPENKPILKGKELFDPRLGLPIAKGRCTTCNGETVDQCQGHFAHSLLPLPIYHPNHVGKLVTLLRKICLNCGQPKKKRVRKEPVSSRKVKKKQVDGRNVAVLKESSNPAIQAAQPSTVHEDDDEEYFGGKSGSRAKRKYAEVFVDVEARADKEAPEAEDPVIVLSSDDDLSSTAQRKQPRVHIKVEEDDNPATSPQSSVRRSWNYRKRKDPNDSSQNTPSTPQHIDTPRVETWNPLSVARSGKKQKTGQSQVSQSGVEVVDDTFCTIPNKDAPRTKGKSCKYCRGPSPRYPELLLKVEVKDRAKDENLCKNIKMEFKVKKSEIDKVASDYWGFVEGKKPKVSKSGFVSRSRLLLPSEALTIVGKVPKAVLASVGMHPLVAQPEGLIVECVPVPPNCTRIQDDAFGSTNIGFRQGVDRATLLFSKFLNKIISIKNTRYGSKPTFNAALVEAGELQSLFGHYLREKGAPKAVPGLEKKRVDHSGRVQKRDSRWSLEWLKRHVLGKRSGYSARNVVTGDPFLRVEEIGIPLDLAKYVTIPERVHKFNKEILQECVNVGQSLTGRYRACGAVRLIRGRDRLEITRKTTHELIIGDIVHRHLKDGDLVFVNRPPSLHKHSLLALQVHVQDMSVFTINPAICSPLHADFDGDCLHLFVPQSEETRAELHQLMTIPEQILPSPGGKTIIGLSQDNILASHLMTSTPGFLTKEEMYQMAMWWNDRRLPVPAIVKSPAGGPMWALKQVIDMTIPAEFSYRSNDGAVEIKDGELVSYDGKGNWLTSTNGLIRVLAQHSPYAAVCHLDCSQSVLREWLLSRGFSVSLKDFYGAADHKSRRQIIDDLLNSIDAEQSMAVNKELIFDEKYQKLDLIQSDMDSELSEENARVEVLEEIAVGYFQQKYSEIGEEFGSSIGCDNNLLAMVRSGSKGSVSKALQQMGCLGLQLYKGEHLLCLDGNRKLEKLASSMNCEETWEARGLVKSSLLDGLNPLEFYIHAITVRAGLIRQSLEVTEPGELFKKLMLFLRDLHISYDGTVRNKSGLEIIQFAYDGARAHGSSEDSSSSEEYVMPGEAVGILAATAIAQPAYQVMLEANHNVGSKKIRPLALLQDTIFPRSGSNLKTDDRRTILRLKPCVCNIRHCEEFRALRLKDALQPLSIDMLANTTAIQYIPENSDEWDICRADGTNLRLPWIGHVQFDMNALNLNNLNISDVVRVLETAFLGKSYSRTLLSSYLKNPVFYYRNVCDCMGASGKAGGPCLHFSASLKSKTSKKMAKLSNKKLLEFVDALRDVMLPLILKTTVKGDDRIESAKIIWEDAAWSPSGVSDDSELLPPNPNGELVVEVIVQEKLATTRGTPWTIMKEVCGLLDMIDWRRSAPYSVQEIRHSLGVEAAQESILKRLTLATEAAGTSVKKMHLKLVADLMVHSGDVNGITPFGYRDMLRSLKTSAPFTAGAFRAPIKTFMEAGEKGEEEVLSGVLASSMFGKRVPVGTGADFSLQLKQTVNLDPQKYPALSMVPMQPVDIFECLKEVNDKIRNTIPDTPPLDEEMHLGTTCGDMDTNVGVSNGWGSADGAGWGVEVDDTKRTDAIGGAWGGNSSPVGEAGGWGSSPSRKEDAGGRGAGASSPKETNGWGSPPSKKEDAGGWGAAASSPKETNGWGSPPSQKMDTGGWGASVSSPQETNGWGRPPSNDVDTAGWGAEAPTPSKKASSSHNTGGGVQETSEANDSAWNCPTTAEGSGWGEECPVEPSPSIDLQVGSATSVDAANGWDSIPCRSPCRRESLDKVNGWDSGSPMECNETNPDWAVMKERPEREGWSVGERPERSSRRNEAREFKPTGANNIPLGRARHFGPPGVDASILSLNTEDGADPPIMKSKENNETEEDDLLANGGSPSHGATGGWDSKEETSGWTVASVQEGGSEARWGNIEDPGINDSQSGWSNAVQGEGLNPDWSPRGQKDGADHHGKFVGHRGRPVGGRGASNGVGLRSWREPTVKVDARKDSEDWTVVINLVRAVKLILQNSEPEEKLKEEDHQLLMTQVLPHHPNFTTKVGCGVDFFKVANYKATKCFFIVRTDGTQDDFSYHKCLQTMATKKNPPLDDLYASAFMSYNGRMRSEIPGRSSTPVDSQTPATTGIETPSPGCADMREQILGWCSASKGSSCGLQIIKATPPGLYRGDQKLYSTLSPAPFLRNKVKGVNGNQYLRSSFAITKQSLCTTQVILILQLSW